jgi:hypothetical protein
MLHDLRTSGRAIDGYPLCRIVLDKLDADARSTARRRSSDDSRMGRLIDDILDFSCTDRLPMNATEFDMAA